MIWEIVFVVTILSAIAGFVILSVQYLKLYSRRGFVLKYRRKYNELINYRSTEKALNPELYEWLLRKSARVELELGSYGYVAHKPAFSNTIITKYAVLPNTLQQIGRGMARSDEMEYVTIHLTRFIGILDERLRLALSKLTNPLLWIQTSIQYTLLLPIRIIQMGGIISLQTLEKAEHHPLINLVASGVAFLASLISIIVGWDEISAFIDKIFNSIT